MKSTPSVLFRQACYVCQWKFWACIWLISVAFLHYLLKSQDGNSNLEQVIDGKIHFAPIGLLDMYNSGGAMDSLRYSIDLLRRSVKLHARGCGGFGAYSNMNPKSWKVKMKDEAFIYDSDTGWLERNWDSVLRCFFSVFLQGNINRCYVIGWSYSTEPRWNSHV
mgnify:CR=1 FL=1